MTIETLRHFFAWCAVINYAILLLWCALTFWVPALASIATKWFGLTDDQFRSLNYAGITFYKMAIILFTLVPYLSLRIMA